MQLAIKTSCQQQIKNQKMELLQPQFSSTPKVMWDNVPTTLERFQVVKYYSIFHEKNQNSVFSNFRRASTNCVRTVQSWGHSSRVSRNTILFIKNATILLEHEEINFQTLPSWKQLHSDKHSFFQSLVFDIKSCPSIVDNWC